MNLQTNTILTPPNNLALAVLFGEMADCYKYLGNEDRFRAIAYENVSRVLYNMKEDIGSYMNDKEALDAIKGIGESIADKIIEYLKTGSIKKLEILKRKVPFELLELIHINGVGPSTVKQIHDELGVNNKADLTEAIAAGKLSGLRGFGQKRIENLQRSLKLYVNKKRMSLKDAEVIGNNLLKEISSIPGVTHADLAGSLRRKKETVGDIDIVIEAEPKNRKKIIAQFIRNAGIKKILVKGTTRVSVLLFNKNIQVDCRLVNKDEYGAAMLYFTGSKEHTIRLRTMARERGYKINEYGIFNSKTNQKLAGSTEEDMYSCLNMHYIPPELRLNDGEIERAAIN